MNFENAIAAIEKDDLTEEKIIKFIQRARNISFNIQENNSFTEEEKEEELVAYQLFIDDMKTKLRFKKLSQIILTSD